MNRDYLLAYSTILVFMGMGIMPLALQVIFMNVVSDFQIALFSTVYWLSSFFFSPIWGIISDATRRRKLLLMFSIAISSIIALFHAIYIDYYSILILRFLFGVFMAAYLPITLSILLENTNKEEAGKKSSLFNISRAIGFLISGYVASLVLYLIGAIELFIVSSIIIASSLIFILTMKCEAKETSNLRNELKGRFKLPGTGFIRRNRGHLLVLSLTLRHTTIMGLFSLIFVYMLRRGIPDYLLGTLGSMNNLTQIILMYPMGYLSDRIGRKPMYLIGFFLSAIVPIGLIFAKDFVTFSMIFILIGISFSTLIAGITPFLKDIAPGGREAESMSFLSISRGFGSIIGPIIVGFLVTQLGYELMYVVLFFITLMSLIIALFTEETLRK